MKTRRGIKKEKRKSRKGGKKSRKEKLKKHLKKQERMQLRKMEISEYEDINSYIRKIVCVICCVFLIN